MGDSQTSDLSIRHDRVGMRDLAYQALRDAIVSGRLRPGMPVPEGRLAEELQVSRTPLREAFVRLQSERLLRRAPNGRLFVTDVSPEEAINLYAVRIALEELALVEAIDHSTPGLVADLEASIASFQLDEPPDVTSPGFPFHHLIYERSRNPINRRMFEQLHVMTDRYGMIGLQDGRERREQVNRGHQQIVDAVRRRDPAAACAAMREHLADGCERVVSTLGDISQYRGELERLRSPK